MRFFNLFTPARTEIANKKSIDAAPCGRSERPRNRTDTTPCLSDVYNIGTRARRRTANTILSGRSFFHRVLQIRRDFLTTCTQKSTRGKKSQVDVALCGRSMVEMLGVLAIVGVLSVGAISGYSKAMFKYKLNKQTEQLNTVINTVGRNVLNFRGTTGLITSYFIKLGEIPKEMIRTNETAHIYDIFGNNWRIYIIRDNNSGLESMNLAFSNTSSLTKRSSENLEICRNLIVTAKENSGNIFYISTLSGYKTDEEQLGRLEGDSLCNSGRVCLKNVTLEQIYEICTKHIGTNNAEFKIVWHIGQ